MNAHVRQQFADAQAALPFVVQQGRNIEARIYQRRYPKHNYAAHVPVVTEGNPWAIGTQFQIVDVTGEAKILSGGANDMPFNAATRDQSTHDFFMLGAGWEWNMEEVNQASMYGINLNDVKALGASASIERLLNGIAMVGTTEKNITGFVNSAAVPRADAAAEGDINGGTNSKFWKHKTNEQIEIDINAALSSISTVTGEVEYADTLRLPPEAFRLIATRKLGATDGTTTTLLENIRKNNVYTAETGQPLNILPLRELATASEDGGGRLIAYRKSEEVVRFHLPMPRLVLPVRAKSLMGFEQGIIARTGGTEWRLPKAATYLDEITDVPA